MFVIFCTYVLLHINSADLYNDIVIDIRRFYTATLAQFHIISSTNI